MSSTSSRYRSGYASSGEYYNSTDTTSAIGGVKPSASSNGQYGRLGLHHSSSRSRDRPVGSPSSRLPVRGSDRLGSGDSGTPKHHSVASLTRQPSGYSSAPSSVRGTPTSTHRTPAAVVTTASRSAATSPVSTGYLARSRGGSSASPTYVPSTSESRRRKPSATGVTDTAASTARPSNTSAVAAAGYGRRAPGVIGAGRAVTRSSSSISVSSSSSEEDDRHKSTSSLSSRFAEADSSLQDSLRSLNVSSTLSDDSSASPHAGGRELSRQFSLDVVARELPQGGGMKGLGNLGNTCFMNSILQCLFATPELMKQLIGVGSKTSGLPPVTTAFTELVQSIWKGGGKSSVTPQSFLNQVSRKDRRWGGGRQQDSQEFLHFLLEAMQTETNRVKGKPQYQELNGKGSVAEQAREAIEYSRKWSDSVIDDIFGGVLQSTVVCKTCQHASYCFDTFLDLSVPISGRTGGCTLSDCLESFTERENLGKGDAYRCEKCKGFVSATKQLQIYSLPKILIIHLKRFSSSSGLGRFSSLSKNTNAVKLVPKGLDLSLCCNPVGAKAANSLKYDLIGISNHSGSLGGGHYTATCKNIKNGEWYDFNDSHASPTSEPRGSSQSAYVLFYRRQDN